MSDEEGVTKEETSDKLKSESRKQLI